MSQLRHRTWNYRLVEDASGEMSMREVHYEDGVITLWSEGPTHPLAESRHDMQLELDKMQVAMAKPVLLEADLLDNDKRILLK